ncbi:Hydroxyisourate hydrolase [Lindgomyces ingoldianus]|uniref:Hydroxyisourate hydrolase n=1 Tax=Lindgomyces ingoldianus TaxID=673940 RepID=A0ACB6R7P5_9PLEO|nr:Hydroxyisourate hydrolase [Lindgomyces ingoldianus]KAF2475274.1 Hydroxyisourate hydrolase [Lindgomyces ingoldianus]
MTTPSPKPPITCHVLDTTLGRPASSIPVTLTLHNPPSSLSTSSLTFTSTTNSDGRVTSWQPSSPFSADGLEVVFKRPGDQTWSLRFDTERYFGERGVKAFFPEVVVRFLVREGERGRGKDEHYHVPVLLGPFGYTTYRGS